MKAKSILLYDATCRLCQISSKKAMQLVPEGTLVLQDINDPAIQARYGITPEAAKRQMHIVTRNGKVTSGAQAVREILKLNTLLSPVAFLWFLPGFGSLAQFMYLWVADHRYLILGETAAQCQDEACQVHLGKVA